MRARVTGILLSRNFSEGAAVKKGQSLFTIDPAPFEAALARAEADVAAAEARLDQAKRNAARFKPLYAEKAVSQKEYDDAVSAEAIGARRSEGGARAARRGAAEPRATPRWRRRSRASRAARCASEGTLVSGPDVLLTA